MSKDPDMIRRQKFEETGRLIRLNASRIVDVWMESARSELESAHLAHRDALRNQLPSFLEHVGSELTEHGVNRDPERDSAAREHGHERWRNGWKLSEVVRDYQLLRLVMIDEVNKQLDRDLDVAEIKAINIFVDDAIEDAVVAYVDDQEFNLSRSRDAAEAGNRLKSEFVANVSHEIRTPMNAILGMTELALDEELTAEVRDYIQTAHDSARSLLALVNDLLDFSRMEAGKLELESTPFDLWETLDETAKALSTAAAEKGLELLCDVPETVPRYVVGDPLRLRQVITNLIGNAIKFTERGEVILRVESEEQSENSCVVRFAVIDTGIGISDEDQVRIFSPFTQADASTTRVFGGSGLGLAICSELITQLGGQLELKSALGEGSEFFFSAQFDIADSPTGLDKRGRERLEQLHGKRVLVVDDNATNRKILEGILSRLSLEVDSLDNAEAALQRLRAAASSNSNYDFVLIDALMPGQDGFSVIEAINEDDQLEATTVLMLSSADRSVFTERTRSLNMDGFLEKPVSRRDLVEVISAAGTGATDTQGEKPTRQLVPMPLKLLVVEDTPANQKMVQAILRKRGHNVTVANNGREAIEKMNAGEFDVVLMDVQMPTVDGYQATKAIREMEDAEFAQIPIIAMTAHAMKGDADKCFQVGMDDYISKPIDARRLVQLVEKWGTRRGDTAPPQAAKGPADTLGRASGNRASGQNVADFEVALGRLDGSRQLLADMIGFFREDSPQLLERLESSLSEGNAAEAKRAAHSIKGLASNFEAQQVTSTALKIEQLAAEGELERAAEELPGLRRAIVDLEAAFVDYENR